LEQVFRVSNTNRVLGLDQERLLFSVLVWPSLESEEGKARVDHYERVELVKRTILRGASEMAWSMELEVDHALVFDPERGVDSH